MVDLYSVENVGTESDLNGILAMTGLDVLDVTQTEDQLTYANDSSAHNEE